MLRTQIKARLLEKQEDYRGDVRFQKLFTSIDRETVSTPSDSSAQSSLLSNSNVPAVDTPIPSEIMQVDMFPNSVRHTFVFNQHGEYAAAITNTFPPLSAPLPHEQAAPPFVIWPITSPTAFQADSGY
jgi:hypothetical protein